MKRHIRATPRASRTEVFLHWAEEHPAEIFGALDQKTDALIRDLERREREAAREYHRAKRHLHDPSDTVPF
jgi:hypothetical protein